VSRSARIVTGFGAAHPGVPVTTVYQWRTKRYGPVGLRIGKHVRYRPADVERWLSTLRREVA
jgi:predicted DNA-binding transcriptional regulator AlpA